ncbi:hypothetical protein [Streptomyces sp. NPDC088752]|uniref:hypothetical protein n=1 Tax=Streptomyces sp. NPDC088752 TaxID=3154963 RepID=UPI00341EA9F5
MSEDSSIQVVRLGGTIRLTHRRSDGGRLEMTLTQGEERTTSVYAVTDARGRLRTVSARSWANRSEAPALGVEMREALEQAGA